MKRIFAYLIIIIFVSINAHAASSTVWVVQGGDKNIEVFATYTCDGSTGAYTTEVFKDAANKQLNLNGYYLYQIVHDVGATGPTDNSDLYVYEHNSSGRDVLGGAGVNFIDNADATPLANIAPWRNGVDAAMPVYGPLYLVISNNSVNSATGTLIFKFIK